MNRLLPLLLLAAACRPNPKEEGPQKETFLKAIDRHFEDMNLEAAYNRLNKHYTEDVAREGTATLDMFSTYAYAPDGFILIDVTCANPNCRFKQDVLAYNKDKGAICAACARELVPKGKGETDFAAPAFKDRHLKMLGEIESNAQERKAKVTVRYLRHQWMFDKQGIINPGKINEPAWETRFDVVDKAPGVAPKFPEGFYRQIATFRCEAVFEYHEGRTTLVSSMPEIPIRHWAVKDHPVEVTLPPAK